MVGCYRGLAVAARKIGAQWVHVSTAGLVIYCIHTIRKQFIWTADTSGDRPVVSCRLVFAAVLIEC